VVSAAIDLGAEDVLAEAAKAVRVD
jgi:hypothetical protein